MTTQGCVTVTAELVTAGSVTVASGIVAPMAGTARRERAITVLGQPKVITTPLVVTVAGDDLVINLADSKPGALVCWTAYS